MASKNKQRKEKRGEIEQLKDKYRGVFICLNMIVKDEEDNILKCLNSVKNIINGVVICDTGSSDKTIEIIEQFLITEKLPGIVVKTKWEDHFGWNRTEALRHAEFFMYNLQRDEHQKLDLKYYVLFMDADDYAVDDKNNEGEFVLNRKGLTLDRYNVMKLRGNVKYPFPWVLRIYPDPSINSLIKKLSIQKYFEELGGPVVTENDSESDDSDDSDDTDDTDSDSESGDDSNDKSNGPKGPVGPVGPKLNTLKTIKSDDQNGSKVTDSSKINNGSKVADSSKINNSSKVANSSKINNGSIELNDSDLSLAPCKRWWWVSTRHETPTSLKWGAVEGPLITGGFVNSLSVGCRSRDPLTYLKDTMAFLKDLQRDPKDSRSIFYVAESARNANLPEVARIYYKKCMAMNAGFDEEKYYSALQLVIPNLWKKHKRAKNIQILLSAYQWCPQRYEAPYYLLVLWKQTQLWRQGYHLIQNVAAKLPPSNALFADTDINEWRFYDEAAIFSFWNECKDQYKELSKKALKSTLLPDDVRQRIKGDLQKYN